MNIDAQLIDVINEAVIPLEKLFITHGTHEFYQTRIENNTKTD